MTLHIRRILIGTLFVLRWQNFVRNGQFWIIGEKEFTSRYILALARLKDMDRVLFQAIEAEGWIVAEHDRNGINWSLRVCRVDKKWLSPGWETWGLLVQLLYAHFTME